MKKAVIIGAGPAGLTGAYELLKRTDVNPIILEKSADIGGISKTINYKGNRMDMGPHRFFSKSDRVMDWWLHFMPLEKEGSFNINYQNKGREIHIKRSDPTKDREKVMLVIQRLTRIYFLRKFFAYPIQLSLDTLRTLGLLRTLKIIFSYLHIKCFPRKPENTLEDFIINKFGVQLYQLFFKDYTEKVWGVPCHSISAEWGAQRIKGVSLQKALTQALKTLYKKNKGKANLRQKETETSLIDQFLYPKYGPGSLWEEVARQIQEMGGKILLNQDVRAIYTEDNKVCSIQAVDSTTGELTILQADYIFSTMPVQELISGMGDKVPQEVRDIAAGLQYRDFINVGILLKHLSTPGKNPGEFEKLELKDNWIYIQEKDVKVGRLMIYNNWGDGMIKDPSTTWIGMEYFCNKAEPFWALDDHAIQEQAIKELEKMALARREDVLDITVRRMEKTYPAYFGTYNDFGKIRAYTDQFTNLFLVGRNGMHKYNNADHSMLTAMVAVDNICDGILSKDNIWSINTEQEYHEEKQILKEQEPVPVHKKSVRQQKWTLNGSFSHYIFKNPQNRTYCLVALGIFLIQFILFKFRYPYANYMPDSYSYLQAAYTNADVNMWPVAYSKFLRLLSVFTHSDKIVVGIQYLILQASAITLLLSVCFLLQPGKLVRNVLWAFFVFNPIPFFIANYISADAIFIGCSLFWFTSLLWILYRPAFWQIVVQGSLLLACFTLRYNAIYYPLVAMLVFILSRQNWKRKMAGIALGLALVVGSYLYTSAKMQQTTGQRQFSAFGGWQLANNALYMYEHIPASQRGAVPKKFEGLEAMVRQHMDTLSKVKLTKDDSLNSYFYLWSGKGPLIQYMERQWKKDSVTPYFKRWASESPLYLDYAIYLIRKYPWQFLESFARTNSMKFAVPPTEFLGTYNMGGDSVGSLAKDWFQYKSQKVYTHSKKEGAIWMTEWYPIFGSLVNLLLCIHLIGFIIFYGFKRSGPLFSLLILVVTFWIFNLFFSVFASPIVLRYQAFPIAVTFCAALLIGEFIYKKQVEV